MKLMIDTTHKTFAPEVAEKVAMEYKKSDPDWDYVVRHDPKGTGNSFIEVFDEDGEFVGRV